MLRRDRITFWLTLLGVSLIVAVGASYLHLVGTSPLAFHEMDFDENGFVTFSELVYANSYATRHITGHDRSCTEYYALKDGSQLKIICDGDERSSSSTTP